MYTVYCSLLKLKTQYMITVFKTAGRQNIINVITNTSSHSIQEQLPVYTYTTIIFDQWTNIISVTVIQSYIPYRG